MIKSASIAVNSGDEDTLGSASTDLMDQSLGTLSVDSTGELQFHNPRLQHVQAAHWNSLETEAEQEERRWAPTRLFQHAMSK